MNDNDICKKSPNGKHEPDLSSAHITDDNGTKYLDINCIHCGCSGCIGMINDMIKEINW